MYEKGTINHEFVRTDGVNNISASADCSEWTRNWRRRRRKEREISMCVCIRFVLTNAHPNCTDTHLKLGTSALCVRCTGICWMCYTLSALLSADLWFVLWSSYELIWSLINSILILIIILPMPTAVIGSHSHWRRHCALDSNWQYLCLCLCAVCVSSLSIRSHLSRWYMKCVRRKMK